MIVSQESGVGPINLVPLWSSINIYEIDACMLASWWILCQHFLDTRLQAVSLFLKMP